MSTRSRALGLGLGSILLFGLGARALPGCGGRAEPTAPPDDAGTDAPSEAGGTCAYAASFVLPANGAKLGVADDKSGMSCSNGLVTDVSVATSAPDGTPAKLFANDKQVGTATAASAKIVFASVALPSKGQVVLRVSIGDSDCASEGVTIDCGVPACSVASPTGPYLNGRAVADGGDRVNNPTDPFATQVVVNTDLADGEMVTLTVDGKTTQSVAASGGKATFASVTMAPDGTHNVKASCTSASGNTGSSGVVDYDVITAPVDLTVTQPPDGKTFGLADDVDPATAGVQFDLCGTTATADAIDVPADARNGQKNFCAAVGTATASCVSMTKASSGTGGSACVRMTCPSGSAPFDVNVTLSDKAGNQAVVKRSNLRCESTLPSVAIVSPVAYDASKPSTILNLAAGDTGSASGALKKTIVACTDKSPAKAQFFTGLAGGTLTAVGSPVDVVAATAADNCPSSLGYVARLTATLPESTETTDGKGTLVTASELRVDVTDAASNLGSSPKVDVWVDSVPPSMTLFSPACGKIYSGTTDVTDTVSLSSDTLPLTFKVTGSATTGTYPINAFDTPPSSLPGVVTIQNVKFYLGSSALTLQATDAAGNATSALSGCSVYVGTPPVVTITSPVAGAKFGADANVDPATHDYKTSVSGTVTGGATSATSVTLKLAGTAVATAPISAGAFTFSNVLLPESDALAITVELSDANYGTIGKTETVVVDTHVPTMSGALTAAVDAATRRAGGFALGWTAGSDYDPTTGGTRACDHYEIRRAAGAVSDATWSAATLVSNTVASSVTATNATTGRLPASWNFGIRCVDKAGNMSPTIATSAAATADFIRNTLAAPGGATYFGLDMSASLDLNGDAAAIPDLVVGSASGNAYVYFGHRPTSTSDSGYAATPDLILTGSGLIGASVAELTDFDGDGRNDLALGAPGGNTVYVISGTAIMASATPVGVTTLGSNALTLSGDATASLFGTPVRNASGFFSTTSKGAVLMRGKFGGLYGVIVVKSRPISGGSLTLPAGADFFVKTAATTSSFAQSDALQDVDGDGLTDLLTGEAESSSAFLFKGRTTSSATALLLSAADGTLVSSTPGDSFGYAVGMPGKITGSRYDAVVGAYAGTGRADVITTSGTTLTRAGSITTTISGQQLGSSTLNVMPGQTFDVDRDGLADVLVCSRTATASASGCYLTYGASPFTSVDVGSAAEMFSMPTSPNVAAHSIGDIDGDGYVDFALCAPGGNNCTIVR